MAEGREYISHESELGSVSISEEVLAVIAAAAAVEVEGVSCLGSGLSSDGMHFGPSTYQLWLDYLLCHRAEE